MIPYSSNATCSASTSRRKWPLGDDPSRPSRATASTAAAARRAGRGRVPACRRAPPPPARRRSRRAAGPRSATEATARRAPAAAARRGRPSARAGRRRRRSARPPGSRVATCRRSFDAKCAKRPLFERSSAAASRPMVSPSSPTSLASSTARSRIDAAGVLALAHGAQNRTTVRLCRAPRWAAFRGRRAAALRCARGPPARYASVRMCGRFTLTERDLAEARRRLPGRRRSGAHRGLAPPLQRRPGTGAPPPARRGRPPPSRARALRPREPRGRPAPHQRARRDRGGAAEFRAAWASRRCAIPADGFYEWGGPPRDRRPIRFHDPAGRPLLFAGLWGEVEGGALAFAILTTAANEPVAALHDRMPVLLPADGLAAWLAGGDPPGAAPEGALVGRPVSARVNAAGARRRGLPRAAAARAAAPAAVAARCAL